MSASPVADDFAWAVRQFVYEMIVESGRPPTVAAAAAALHVPVARVRAAYEWLDAHHALFLEPGTHAVRMAHPFSGIRTPFRVHAASGTYWANCAWDMLGIPAALGTDARVEAACTDDGRPATITVERGKVRGQGEVVHFLLPFRRWYDDLILT